MRHIPSIQPYFLPTLPSLHCPPISNRNPVQRSAITLVNLPRLYFTVFHSFSTRNYHPKLSLWTNLWKTLPRIQPYLLATIGSFSSLFNVQSKSINFNFGHFSLIFGQNTKAIALLFGQNWLIFITFQCAIKINQFQFRSFLAQFWAKYQGYSLTFWPKLAHFHHFSMCNQNQSISISVISRSILGKIPRL